MDLRGRSSRASLPTYAIAIPQARQPLQALTPVPRLVEAGGAEADESAASSAHHLRRLVRVVEAAAVVVAVYVLIGAGIGEMAGAVMVGIVAGSIAGVCAIAAILLIRGSAVAAAQGADGPR